MLAVSPLRNGNNERETEMEVFSADCNDFTNGKLFDAIDLDDLFIGINGGDLLLDLEMDPEFSVSVLCEDSETNFSSSSFNNKLEEEKKDTVSASASDLGSGSSGLIQAEEIASKPDNGKGKKSLRNRSGKKKLKVDWTVELHKRFVEAVEQLGVDKAVPSRILEIMGSDYRLTRHNIASHLQKYRSQQKHRLARKPEVVCQSLQGWQLYGATSTLGKRDINPWIAAPTIGFPPLTPAITHFRPLHVWGHPPINQSLMHTWPKHVASPPPPPGAWSSAHHPPHTSRPPPAHPSFWHSQNHRFSSNPHVPTPQEMYDAETKFGSRIVSSRQTLPQPPSQVHPSKESVDAAIGDVLSKPWMPLPLGLNPPSTDSVMVELQRQGISTVPPTRAQ